MTIAAIVGTVAIVGLTIAIGVYIDRRVKLLPRAEDLAPAERNPPPKHAAGEAPATAIRARDAQQTRLRGSQRCTQCRAAMISEPDDTVRYDNRALLVLQFRCPECAARRALYVDPAA